MAKTVGTKVSFDIQSNCGCPPGYTDVGNNTCQQIETLQPTPPSQPITLDTVSPNSLYITYGAIIYEDISLKQWPIIATPQGSFGWTLGTNTPIPASGPNPNPYLPGGPAYTSLNPGTDGVNYIGGIGTGGEHAKVIKAVPGSGWPGISLSPANTLNGRALRESTIIGGVLNYGIGNTIQPQFQLLTSPWIDGVSNTNNWFNNQGVGASDCPNCVSSPSGSCYICAKWYGFTHCITIAETKTYYVAVASNNAYRFKMNGNLVVEFNVGDGLEPTLSTANIFPITLPAGTHVFQVDMLNYSGDGGIVFEIYDCSLAQLQGATTLGQLDTYTIFSTKDKLKSYFDVSNVESQGYICPEGYTYSTCNGSPECIKITTAEPIGFNVRLTPCCGDTSIIHVVPHDKFLMSPIQPGTTACIEDIHPDIGCWLIEETCDAVDYITPFTLNGTFFTCDKCLEECKPCNQGCRSCPPGTTMNAAGECQGLESIAAVQNPTTYTAGLGSWAAGVYGANAGEFYEDITAKPWPIVATNGPCVSLPAGTCSILNDNSAIPLIVTNRVANPVWGGDGGSSTNYRLRVAGLWTTVAPLPINEWIGFTYCINITQTKTYYLAFAVDDIAKFYLDGVLMIDHSAVGWSFRTWKIIPVTLNAGTHIFDGRVLNSGSAATFGFEIYDATLAQLLAVAAPGDLDPYIIFSTKDYIGATWMTGEVSGYTCPDGYSLNTCDGIVCSRVITVPAIECCLAIKDCTTNEEVYLVTPGDNSHGLPDLKSLVGNGTIGKLCFDTGCVDGCFYVAETDSDCTSAIPYENVLSFTQYPDCPKCYERCYLLTNCQNSEETIVTNTDLSLYLNYVIAIKGCKDQCWIVTVADNCDDCTGPVVILKACPPTSSGSGLGQTCTYTLNDATFNGLQSYSVTINGQTYTFTYQEGSGFTPVFNNINGLDLGQFSIGSLTGKDLTMVMTGTETYGPICFTINDVETCVEPTCQTISEECSYTLLIPRAEGNYSIVINGITYTSDLMSFSNPIELTVWLNSLGLGTFTAVFDEGNPRNVQIFISGSGDVLPDGYGTLTATPAGQQPPVSADTVCVPFVTETPDCACCLPKPEVVVQPLLNTRPVEPGYKTPGCSPEYTEKVNCAFGQVMNKQMLATRYGLATCCTDSETNWEIKKELLDFEAIKDNNLTPCNNEL